MAFTIHKLQDCKLGKQRAKSKCNMFAKAAKQEVGSENDNSNNYVKELFDSLYRQNDKSNK